MDGFYPTVFVCILICHIVSGCPSTSSAPGGGAPSGAAPGGLPPGVDGTIGHANIDSEVLRSWPVRRAVRRYQERSTPQVMFTAFDVNKDGSIDALEWMEAGMTKNVREFVKILDAVDENKDDVLSLKEFEAIVDFPWKYGEIKGGTTTEEET